MNAAADHPAEICSVTSNGVPFLARPAASADAPVILAWHLLDPPRTEVAFAAALPLTGLDAHRIYLGLPMTGRRTLPGGDEQLMALLADDPVTRVHARIHDEAVAEAQPAVAEIRELLGAAPDAPVGMLGGSAGSSVAAAVLAAGWTGARAAVLVSPMLQLRPLIDVFSPRFGAPYHWHPEAAAAADRMDFVARAHELTASGAALRVIAGADDEPDATLAPTRDFVAATGADLQLIEGVGHALADSPGAEPAPQTAAAARYDALATDWFRRHLT